ncbi:FixH family protein [Gilvibacter sp.]|uniref:FixH family protein n=1 Tax=Gilvibacter sp. TaxID=2729997 RepID=UPI0035BE56BC
MSTVKLNWGTGLVIGMLLFIGFILYFVITMMTDSKYDHELVVEDYYKQELILNQQLEAKQNLATLSGPIVSKRAPQGWILEFPEELNKENTKGTVFLYRPSDKHLDSDFPLVLSESNLLIPETRLLDGRWNIKVSWEYQGKPFLYETTIQY